MKNHSILVERFINELELRNYSFGSIKTYTELLCVLENKINEDLSKITVADFKKFLHQNMMVEKVSISYINQSISAFKLLQTSVLIESGGNLRFSVQDENISCLLFCR